MPRLSGKVALISGAAMGMGASHARLFAQEGARVVLGDVAEPEGTQLAAELGRDAAFTRLDVTDPASWQSAVEFTERTFGPIDVLVNNAGVAGPPASIADLPVDVYHRTIDIDEHGVYLGMRAVLPGMAGRRAGSIVNISSTAGFAHANTPNIAYTAAKFAVRGMTKAMAVEYGGYGVRINSVHPGGVLTPMVANGLDDAGRAAVTATVPLGRFAEPHEISQVVLFLASDDASYVTGTELVADGGMLAR